MQKRTARVRGSTLRLQAFRDHFNGELKPMYEEQIRWLDFIAKEVHTLVTQDLIWSDWEKYGRQSFHARHVKEEVTHTLTAAMSLEAGEILLDVLQNKYAKHCVIHSDGVEMMKAHLKEWCHRSALQDDKDHMAPGVWYWHPTLERAVKSTVAQWEGTDSVTITQCANELALHRGIVAEDIQQDADLAKKYQPHIAQKYLVHAQRLWIERAFALWFDVSGLGKVGVLAFRLVSFDEGEVAWQVDSLIQELKWLCTSCRQPWHVASLMAETLPDEPRSFVDFALDLFGAHVVGPEAFEPDLLDIAVLQAMVKEREDSTTVSDDIEEELGVELEELLASWWLKQGPSAIPFDSMSRANKEAVFRSHFRPMGQMLIRCVLKWFVQMEDLGTCAWVDQLRERLFHGHPTRFSYSLSTLSTSDFEDSRIKTSFCAAVAELDKHIQTSSVRIVSLSPASRGAGVTVGFEVDATSQTLVDLHTHMLDDSKFAEFFMRNSTTIQGVTGVRRPGVSLEQPPYDPPGVLMEPRLMDFEEFSRKKALLLEQNKIPWITSENSLASRIQQASDPTEARFYVDAWNKKRLEQSEDAGVWIPSILSFESDRSPHLENYLREHARWALPIVTFLKASVFVLESDEVSAQNPSKTNAHVLRLIGIVQNSQEEGQPALGALFDLRQDLKRMQKFCGKWQEDDPELESMEEAYRDDILDLKDYLDLARETLIREIQIAFGNFQKDVFELKAFAQNINFGLMIKDARMQHCLFTADSVLSPTACDFCQARTMAGSCPCPDRPWECLKVAPGIRWAEQFMINPSVAFDSDNDEDFY
eukprot:TRINITY_DN15442_c0_g1_i1.p1 TRINITY_DN15442_c0_g1~~TRINITY_DN15442_c0_g1_i1.p1  ORF type:complete len:816 (+),score=160.06 TRINITY_DN15442_c0_g1_i1:1-2448(+)